MTDDARAALHEMRVYARHAPLCAYSPTYPDFPVATCDCGFDAVLERYDRLAVLDGWHLASNVATADWTGSTKAAPVDAAEEWRAGDCCPTCEEENGHRLALAALAAPTEEKR